MSKNRLEAFSDGVIAIIITIMVLEMKVPHGDSLGTLTPLVPVFMSYVLSFIYIGIYWNKSSPHAPHLHPGDRKDALGEPASALLAVAVSIRHRLDGGESLRCPPLRTLRRRALGGGDCVLDSPAADHARARPPVAVEGRDRQRLEGEGLAGAVCARNHFRLLLAVGSSGAVCSRGASVAGARSQN